MPRAKKRPETRCNVLRPDFAGNAELRYRRGYSLLIRSLMGHQLTPDQTAAARRASFTSQRRLNEAVALGAGHSQEWSDAVPA